MPTASTMQPARPLPPSQRRSAGRLRPAVFATLLGMAMLVGCVRQHCYDERDCPAPQVCSSSGTCAFECDDTHPCSAGFACVAHRCQARPSEPLACPGDMAAVAGAFCVDRYEASRPDATATSAGRDGSRALSVAGALPWQVADNTTAALACAAAGKRLCTADEWRGACKGPDGSVYAYGDSYDPTVCNGIDAFGGQSFHLAPTGSFPGCTNAWGVFDMNGNLWEHIAGGDDTTVRGGAYNCIDSAALHKCDYVPGTWTPSARGFRCCLTPPSSPAELDGGPAGAPAPADALADSLGNDVAPDAPDIGAGCVDDGGADARDGMHDGMTHDGGLGAADGFASDGEALDTPLGFEAGVVDGSDGETGGPTAPCPPEMALVGSVCMDRYEASRQDATATMAGTDESMALSQPGVLPWYENPMSTAAFARFQAACAASGKRLCGSTEWLAACQGPEPTTYVFGNDWDPAICNSVDTYCQTCCDILGLTSCPTGENCGYDAALTSSYTPETCFISADYGRDSCHVCFHVMPTGAFPRCTSERGLFDVNGNVWEVVTVPASEDSRGYEVRGGAFNCGSPSVRFACTFIATWSDLYAGFRCCKDL